jgi:hypothetical protein
MLKKVEDLTEIAEGEAGIFAAENGQILRSIAHLKMTYPINEEPVD